MYAPFFGLTQAPFSIAPDPRYLFMSERHREALAHLLYGVGGQGGAAGGAGGGFVLLSGEIGTGKTTVCRCFLEQIPAHCNVAYIFNPKLTVTELLQSVCDEFHVAPQEAAHGPAPTVKQLLDPLNTFLLAEHAAGRNNVLIIDEAQNLSADVLEQLRLLTNLETSERKLLQIILIGQPELRTMLQRPELEQLAQRVIARYHLDALSEKETAQYIRHRLDVAGLKGALPFSRRAVQRIHRLSRGIPRRINLLCDRAMLGAFAGGEAVVDTRIVDKSAKEVFDPQAAVARTRWPRGAVVLGLGLVAGAGLLAMVDRMARSPAVPATAGSTGATSALSNTSAAPVKVAASATAALPAASNPALTAAAGFAPTAPGGAGVTTPAPAPASTASPVLLRSEDQAWRELAESWNVAPPAMGEAPCHALAREQVQCFTRVTSLALIRQLGRPGFVTLDRESSVPSYAMLTALTRDSATLSAGGSEQTVTLAALAARWQGDFSTLWRSPAGYGGRIADGQGGPVIEWVAAGLAAANGAAGAGSSNEGFAPGSANAPFAGSPRLNAALKARLRTFQLAQGLPVDGLPSPMTFMQINRVVGVNEPRLLTEP